MDQIELKEKKDQEKKDETKMPEIPHLLKEHEWDKKVQTNIKKIIDNRIVVLN